MEVLKVMEWDHIEQREDKVFIVWSQYPYWIVVNTSFYNLLKKLKEGTTLEKLANEFGISKEYLSDVLTPLIRAGVVYTSNTPPKISPPPSVEFIEKNVGITGFTLHLTQACNLRCKHCYVKAGTHLPDELSPNEFIKVLQEALPYTNPVRKEVGLLGGEPVIVPEKFFSIAKWIHKTGHYTAGTSTNGTLITDEIAKKAKKYNVAVQISFEGASEESNDRIRGKGHFKRAIEATETLKSYGVITGIIMTVRADNIDEIPKFIQLGKELGVDFIRTNFLKPQGRAKEHGLKMAKQVDIVKKTYEAVKNDKELQKKLAFSTAGFIFSAMRLRPKYRNCGTGMTVPLIDSNGDVYPCQTLYLPEFKLGNVREESIVDIWIKNPKAKMLRNLCVDSLNSRCSKCWLRYLCHAGCRGLTYQLTGNLYAPDVRCLDFREAYTEVAFILSGDPEAFLSSQEDFLGFIYKDILHNPCGGK